MCKAYIATTSIYTTVPNRLQYYDKPPHQTPCIGAPYYSTARQYALRLVGKLKGLCRNHRFQHSPKADDVRASEPLPVISQPP